MNGIVQKFGDSGSDKPSLTNLLSVSHTQGTSIGINISSNHDYPIGSLLMFMTHGLVAEYRKTDTLAIHLERTWQLPQYSWSTDAVVIYVQDSYSVNARLEDSSGEFITYPVMTLLTFV